MKSEARSEVLMPHGDSEFFFLSHAHDDEKHLSLFKKILTI